MKKRIAILGSTGSIGQQALEVIDQHPDLFEVHTLTAHSNIHELAQQTRKYQPVRSIIANETLYADFQSSLAGQPSELAAGTQALENCVTDPDIDLVLTALVGFAGLLPTARAIEAGKPIALANKETLVVAGDFIMQLARKHHVPIYPVDSEHSAIFQCLQGEPNEAVHNIILTASGGPFRNKSKQFLQTAGKEAALQHPNWCMGAKITIDSASLMNKGLEAIEARWLFDLSPAQIQVVVHPQSIIHSLVEFQDSSLKAQLGLPDMRVPILYAFSYPNRLKADFERFNFLDYPQLTFEAPDEDKFPNLRIAFEAMHLGGSAPCVMNAANEVAVEAFLHGQTGFLQMSAIIEQTLNKFAYQPVSQLTDYIAIDHQARQVARKLVQSQQTVFTIK